MTTSIEILDSNMFAYCKNNPVNLSDPSDDLAVEAAIAAIGAAIVSNPSFWIGVGVLAAGTIALGIGTTKLIDQITTTKSSIISKSKTKEKEKENTVVTTKPTEQKATVIYRYGGTNPGNLTPKEKDAKTGLSFSTIAPSPGTPAAVTTIEALNATGIVVAIQDKPNHVSVVPAAHIGTLKEWIDTGSSHLCTQAVKAVVVKWDGGY